MGLKNIYKKSLAMALVRAGHDIHHTMPNRNNKKYQVFVFVHTDELIKDLLELTKREEVSYCHDRLLHYGEVRPETILD
ncbi:hypothetical protein [Peribacillus simplex]|uniref:hypothetical protein n=1 Tax=Peribacillus simplex TaxID=1478 RepID=UPI000BA57A8E|nr:hypothetical protein [Peribacillus simplex]PAK42504.1 hypothetical protein CHI08_09650 [Peribacillus simplex]